jgi:cellulose synthase/poly-beta-1,6-N-acetylglucosamine synthase-like glycosyltransferase
MKLAPMVTVIVPCRNEERFIAGCLDSILAGTYPREALEVLVVDGRSDDGTRPILADYVAQHPAVRMLDNPRRIQPAALNIGIGAARGEILVRMDAHVLYPPNYISDLVAALLESGADNVGGVLVTVPANKTVMARAIAVGMSHPFGVGNSLFRIGVREPRWVETVAFFCCRRETFEQVGLFDEESLDEDSEFNARLIQCGGRILLVPNVVCRYYARASLQQVARMANQYGYSKPFVIRKLALVRTHRQLIPPAFVLVLAVAAILSPWLEAARLLFSATGIAYVLGTLACSLAAARKAGLSVAPALALVFPALHFSYGFGFLRGAAQLALGTARIARRAELPLSR